ncbi:MAG: efflux RND transporter periplasmic adaptor subunit [Bradymonadaceae bacterium]
MADTSASNDTDIQTANWKISLLLSVVLLAVAGGLVYLTFSTEPTAQKGGATKKTAMLVEVVDVERGTFHPRIVAQGTVEPARDIVLRPQVGGKITSVASSFTPGGYVDEGERLLSIEAADYRHALAQRKSDLRQANSNLAVEKGRRDAAKAEYSRFGEKLAPENKALVLREPQLEAAKEKVEAAKAAVEQAKLNLRRTSIEAPFDAHILRRDVNLGSQVSSSDSLARLVGTDRYWVGIELPLSKLRWIAIKGEGGKSSSVRIRNTQAWPEETYRSGHLHKKVGALDDGTRMARVLAAVPDPLARETDDETTPALTIGEYVEVTIKGEALEDVVKVNRDYVRKDDTVWVMKDGKLKIRDVEIAVRDTQYAYISKGLAGGAKVVTTNLSTVEEGAPLRLSREGREGSGE